MLLKVIREQTIVIVIALIVNILLPTISFANADRIFKENNKAVVVVVTYDTDGKILSQGSGFIVRVDGAIITNYHVISNAKNVRINATDKVLDVDGVIYIDKENDIAIIKAAGKNLPTVNLGNADKASVGEKVYVISSPQGLENTISDGILSGIREISPGRKILQITAPISPGSSGGPVFNNDGQVIGIATFLIRDAQNLNFAIPINSIKDKINNEKIIPWNNNTLEDYRATKDYWIMIGINYYHAKMYKEAINSFNQAIRIAPDDAKIYIWPGYMYEELEMYKEAIDSFK